MYVNMKFLIIVYLSHYIDLAQDAAKLSANNINFVEIMH